MSERVPVAMDAELGIVGCCLLGGLETTLEAVESIQPGDFFGDHTKQAAVVLEKLSGRGEEVNGVSFYEEWRKTYGSSAPQELMSSAEDVPHQSRLNVYLAKASDFNKRRRLLFTADTITRKCAREDVMADDILAEAEIALSGEELATATAINGKDSGLRLLNHLEQRFELKGKRSGIETGLLDYDKKTDGIQPGEQTIIAARPSVGKTAIGLNIVMNACVRNDIPTLVVTLEMSIEALCRRLLSAWHRIPLKQLKEGKFNENDMVGIRSFTALLAKKPIHFIDAISGMDCNRLCAAIRRNVRKHGVKLVVIDYLQKIKPSQKQEKRTYEVAEVSEALKAAAVQSGAALLTLAQLNRNCEDRATPPRLSDLADSGQIERDADTVALLHRDRAKDDGREAHLIVAKQRDGEIGDVQLHFDGQYCRFENHSSGL